MSDTEKPATLSDFQNLLKLQNCDSEIDRLALQHETLPAQQKITEIQTRAFELRPVLIEATTKRDEVATELATIEAEVHSIESRVAEINERLYGGRNVTPRDAQAMSQEVKQLNGRRSRLEDSELELMELLDPLRADVEKLETAAQVLSSEMNSAQQELKAGKHELDNQIESLASQLEGLKAQIPAHLISEYQRLQKTLGGVAVAAVVGSNCTGCHLSFSATEIDKIRKAKESEILHCEECGRILVRNSK